LGGWLTTEFSWRWAFGVNVPFGIAVVVGVWWTVTESASTRPVRLDLVGALLAVLGAGSLVFALIQGRQIGWWDVREPVVVGAWSWPWAVSPTPAILGIAVLAIAGFIAWERARDRRGAATMLPLGLFTIRSFRNGNLVAMIVSLGELGLLFVLPLWLQNVLRYDALQTGFLLLALAIGSFLASGAVSGLSRRMSAVGILRLGVGLEFVAVLALGLLVRVDIGWVLLAAVLFAYGLGLGLASAQVTNVVLADVPIEESGRASGMQSTSRQVGSALGIAILGTVLFESLAGFLDRAYQGLGGIDVAALAGAVVTSAGAAIPGLLDTPATAEAGRLAGEAFTHATALTAYVAAAFLGVAFLASLSLRPRAGAAIAQARDALGETTPPAEA
ncbi:MAG: MFS transporter, partial [Microbacteriaceae bacterium]|nr:MFS transporter [Microbacteriaceae bacterium]